MISGSFPALRGNALSSVFHFNLLDGSNEEPSYRLSAGATNLSLDAYGAVNDKLSYIASARRSYRQYILRLLNLAVYPVYNDMLVKVKYKPSYNHEVTLLGIGALDKLRLNDDVASSEVQDICYKVVSQSRQN